MLLKICFRPGNEHDNKAFSDSTKGLEGTIVTDAGYLLKEKELEQMYQSGIKMRPFVNTLFQAV